MGHQKLVETDQTVKYPAYLKKAAEDSLLNKQSGDLVLINMGQAGAEEKLKVLVDKVSPRKVIDNYAEQYAELLLSKNAHLYRANHQVQTASIKDLLAEHYGDTEPWKLGSWVYFPWSSSLVHVLDQKDFEDLRTIRNRDLITASEQEKLYNFNVACFGMSVGSAGALGLAVSGISRQIKLIDGAVISGSNLNRILTGVESVGEPKAEVISRMIYEMNPYSTVLTADKVSNENLDEIFTRPWPVQMVVDEIDDIEMKVRLRLEARSRGIPVVMASELGDTVVLDIERFDREPTRALFHDLVPGIEKLAENPPENHREWMKYAVKILDPKNMPVKLQKTLLKIGSTVVTHPQLGATVMMTGGIIAFAAKNIALGNKLNSGRYVVSLENSMLADHGTFTHKRKHKRHTKIIHSAMKSM